MKPKLTFFTKFLAVLLACISVLYLINKKYVGGYYYYSVYNEIESMKDVPENLTFVNFGTSHGLCSFRYTNEDLAEGCYNLALSGSDIYHNFATLKQFTENLSQGCIVVIPTSYFSFCMSTDEPSQKRYYLYLDKEYINEFSYETLINAKYIPALRSGEFIIKDIIHDQNINAQNMMSSDTDEEKDINTNSTVMESDAAYTDDVLVHIKELETHAAGRSVSWRLAYMNLYSSYMDSNTQLLTDMVNYCYDHGFEPILVTTPVYTALNEEFSDEELDEYYFSNVKKVAENTGCRYIDLSHDEEISNNPDCFGNSDHLSVYGSVVFMEKFRNIISG